MSTTPTKPRYPAKVFHLLQRYRPHVHNCANPSCGKPLTPHCKDGKLEPLLAFISRATCDRTCGAQLRKIQRQEKAEKARARTAKRTEVGEQKKKAKASPPKGPVQHGKKKAGGPVASKVSATSPLEKLEPVETAYVGPQAPEVVAIAPKPTKLPDPRRKAGAPTAAETIHATPKVEQTKRLLKEPAVTNLLLQERAERAARGEVMPLVAEPIEIDDELRRALVQTLEAHDPDFLEVWPGYEPLCSTCERQLKEGCCRFCETIRLEQRAVA